ncbi:hypothetical protein ACFYXF_03395 [Streptomyces sp. NPDC002680]|uniref:hypothetical protein n=1 Tax=Streptomyces sp. NPDC002680 TaxID=3364659 RepID=UPI0036C5941E
MRAWRVVGAEGRLVLAVDVGNRLRPDARTRPDRLSRHAYGRGKGSAQTVPGRSSLSGGRPGAGAAVMDEHVF